METAGLMSVIRGLRGAQVNDAGWPRFDGKHVTYSCFRKEQWAYRRTYDAHVRNELGVLHAEGKMPDIEH
jgi:hypothetical protein